MTHAVFVYGTRIKNCVLVENKRAFIHLPRLFAVRAVFNLVFGVARRKRNVNTALINARRIKRVYAVVVARLKNIVIRRNLAECAVVIRGRAERCVFCNGERTEIFVSLRNGVGTV